MIKSEGLKNMNKQEIYSFLKEKNIWHEITEHKAVYNMAELAEIEIPYPAADAKTLLSVMTKNGTTI